MATVKPDQADALSLPEMLRIMDVATALRQDRELVQEQLAFDDLKERLRAKLIEAAKVTGEEVVPAEVDAAIDQYYSRLHAFKEPRWGLQPALAHLYVRRGALAWYGGLLLASVLLWWWLFMSASAPLSSRGRADRQLASLSAQVERRVAAVKALALDAGAAGEVARLEAEAATYRAQKGPEKLRAVEASLAELEARLGEEYTVTAVPDPNDPRRRNAIERLTKVDGKIVKGHYLFVQARKADGTVLKRRVRNQESNQDHDVTIWAEQVPQDVYERLARDKKADGVLNETTFAVKKRGFPEDQVVMPGGDGQPLRRLGQITEW